MKHCRYCISGNTCREYMNILADLKPTGDSEYDHDEAQEVGKMAETCENFKDMREGK